MNELRGRVGVFEFVFEDADAIDDVCVGRHFHSKSNEPMKITTFT